MAEVVAEGAGQGGGRGEAGSEGYVGEGMSGVGDHASCGSQAERQGVGGGGHGDVFAEQGFEAAGGEADCRGDLCGGFGGVEVGFHAGDGKGHARVEAAVLRGGDLRVRAVALGGEEAGCDLQGEGGAVARADQMQHQIAGRGGSRSGEAVAVDHIAVGQDFDLRMGGGEVFEVFPMHGGFVVVEQARAGENPGPGVDAANGGEAGGHAGKVADQRGGGDLRLAETGDDDERVGTFGLGEGAGGGKLDAAGQRRRPAVGGDNTPAVGVGAKVAVGGAQGVKGGGDFED